MADCVCCLALCSGGDKQGKAASKPADSQPNLSAVTGTSDAAQRKEVVKCLAAKVPQNTHAHTRLYFYTCENPQLSILVKAYLVSCGESNERINTPLMSVP